MLTTYRYGSQRKAGEGIRIGTARGLPRGIRREEWQKKNYFDLRLPLLAPSDQLRKQFFAGKITFAGFSQKYRKEMSAPDCRHVIGLLAATSLAQPISIGCFCEDESRCHRSVLLKLLRAESKRVRPILSCARKLAPAR